MKNGKGLNKKILFVHLGLLHPDYHAIKKCFNKHDVEVDDLNLLSYDKQSVSWTDYGIIDFRNCREYHNNLQLFLKQKEEIENIAKQNNILVTTNPGMFSFALQKSTYLEFFRNAGINIVPTKIVSSSDTEFCIVDYILSKKGQSVVIKPDIGSRANLVVRIQKENSSDKFIVYQPRMENLKTNTKSYVEINKLSSIEIEKFFKNYIKQIQYPFVKPILPALVQDYISSIREFCFVFIDNKFSHVFEKTGDERNKDTFKINHFNFNGKNEYISTVQNGLHKFVLNVFRSIPGDIKTKMPYVRLDVFQNTITGEVFFTEIEAGVPGLCLLEANKVETFVAAFTGHLRK